MTLLPSLKLAPKTRKLLRAAGAVAALLVVLALAAFLVLRISARHRLAAAKAALERELGPLDPAAYAPPPPAPGDNPFDRIAAAAEAIPAHHDLPSRDVARLVAFGDPAAWPDPERVNEWRSRNDEPLAVLRSIDDCRRARVGIDYGGPLPPRPPDMLPLLRATTALLGDARWSLAHDDLARATASADGIACLASTLQREPMLHTQVLAAADRRKLALLAETAIAAPSADAATLAHLVDTLRGLGEPDRFRFALRYEAAFLVRAVERVAQGGGPRHEKWWYRFLRREEATLIAAGLAETYLRLARNADRPFTEIAAELPLPPPRSEFTFSQLLGQAPTWQMILPETLQDARLIRAAETTRRLAVAALELRRQALTTGSYPAALPDLPELSTPEGFAGSHASYTRRPDGGATLSYPAAQEAWQAKLRTGHGQGSDVNPPRFVWELPPVLGSPE